MARDSQPAKEKKDFAVTGKLYLFVGNLDKKVSEKLLYELFIKAGSIDRINLPKDSVSDEHKGYGFIYFSRNVSALYATELFNGLLLYNKAIRVKLNSTESKDIQYPYDNKIVKENNLPFVVKNPKYKSSGLEESMTNITDICNPSSSTGFHEQATASGSTLPAHYHEPYDPTQPSIQQINYGRARTNDDRLGDRIDQIASKNELKQSEHYRVENRSKLHYDDYNHTPGESPIDRSLDDYIKYHSGDRDIPEKSYNYSYRDNYLPEDNRYREEHRHDGDSYRDEGNYETKDRTTERYHGEDDYDVHDSSSQQIRHRTSYSKNYYTDRANEDGYMRSDYGSPYRYSEYPTSDNRSSSRLHRFTEHGSHSRRRYHPYG